MANLGGRPKSDIDLAHSHRITVRLALSDTVGLRRAANASRMRPAVLVRRLIQAHLDGISRQIPPGNSLITS